jgi:hypothetical protein
MRNLLLINTIILIAMVSSCGSERTVIQLPDTNSSYRSTTAFVIADKSKGGADVEDQYRTELESELHHDLQSQGFKNGSGLTIKYWFAEADPGSRAGRFWIGFGVGEGKVQINVEFYDANGNHLSSTDNIGTVSGGFTGGSFSTAIDHAAEAIAEYAGKHYLGSDTSILASTTQSQGSNSGLATSPEPAPAVTPTVAPATPELTTWALSVNTIPQGAVISAYDDQQHLVELGRSPFSTTWPRLTELDVLVVKFQGRHVEIIPNKNESVIVDFSKMPPVITGGSLVEK